MGGTVTSWVVVVVGATVVVVEVLVLDVVDVVVVVVAGGTTSHRKGKKWHSSARIRAINSLMLTGTGQDRVGKWTARTALGWTASAVWTVRALAETKMAAAATQRAIRFTGPPDLEVHCLGYTQLVP